MAQRGRPRQPLTVTDEEREVLERWSRRPKSRHSIAQRARIVLLAADDVSNKDVAAKVGVNPATVLKWRKRFLERRLDGLLDEPRPGTPRSISDADVEAVVVRTLEEAPTDATHWSTRDLAKKAGMSASSVGRIWRAFGLKPWLTDTFKLSSDPQFVDKVRDVVGLYLNPPEHAVVLCVDEKTSIQALDRSQPSLPMRPGQVERRTHDYKRHGVTDLFAALNVATGQVLHQTRPRHRAIEFRQFLDTIDATVPEGLAVHVVLDNASTHKTPAIHKWLLSHPRFTFRFTPTSSSWLNLVERWFAELTRKKLQRSAHRSIKELIADLDAWVSAWNDDPKPFVWHKTADQILDSHSGVPLQTVAGGPTGSNNEQAASLSWSPATSTTAIRGYRIETEADGQWLPWLYRSGSPTSASWSMTTSGTWTGPVTLPCVPTNLAGQCRFRVKAVNWIGEGPASDPITLTQSGLAAAPAVTASTSANDQAVSLNWTAPSSPSAIRGYRVELDWNGQWLPWKYSPPNPVGASFAVTTGSGQTSWIVPCRPSTTPSQCKARVSAVNWAGQGPATEVTFTQSAVPSAPKLTYLANPGSNYPTLGWAVPASTTPIRGYQIDLGVTVGDTTSWLPWKYSTVMSPEFTAYPPAVSAQLPCWQTTTSRCSFRVRAVNYAGPGPWAATTDVGAWELRGGYNPAIPYCGPCVVKSALGAVMGSQAAAADPVNTASGSYFETFSDISVPGRGVPLTLERTYDSGAAPEDRGLGYGWALPWAMWVAADSTGATVTHGNGSQVRFTNGTTAGTYQAMPRVQATLAKNTTTGVYTYVLRNALTYSFDNSGQLTSVTDRNGYVTSVTRPQSNQIVITEPGGRTLTLALTGGHVTSATDPAGRQVSYGYDTASNLTSVTDVGGQVWSYTYDGSHRLTSKVDPRGGTVTNHYDGTGRVDTQTNEVGGVTGFDYSSIPDATKVTDPLGKARVDYYIGGQLAAQTLAYGTVEAGTWNFAYDPLTSAQIRITDPAGRTTRRTVDDHGNPLTVTDPAGRTTSATYNSFDQPLAVTNGAGETTTNTYDTAANIRTVTRPHAVGQTATTTYLYGDVAHPGDVTGVTDPLSHTTTVTYDANGYRSSVADSLGNTATWAYDNVGRLTDSVTPRGNHLGADPDDYRSTYQSDAYGHTTSATDPLGRTSTASYLSTGQLSTSTDPLSQTTTHSYDLAGRSTATIRPDSSTISTGYDAAGNMTSQTDGAGATTAYTYNARNQVASSTDPLGRINSAAYDTSGRLVTTTDPASQTVSHSYDAAGQLTGLNYSSAGTHDVAYTYDAAGRRTSMVDGTGTSSYSYDPAGRLASYSNGAGQSLSYGYDLASRETAITYPGSRTVTRAYDSADRLTSVTDWVSRASSFTYDADSNLTQIAYPNTVTTTNSYDPAGQIENIDIANTSGALVAFAYTHRDDGLLATQTPTGIPGAATEAFGYDPNSRLGAVNSDTYAFDTADNPTLLAGTAQQFNAANELCWSAPAPSSNACASPPSGATTYSFDTRGNRTSRTSPGGDVTAYGYDQANRLTSATLNGNAIGSYSYDGDGLRQAKNVGGSTTHQLWDPNASLPLLALDGTDAYITGPHDRPLARIDAAGTPTYTHGDRQGSTRLLTDNTGAVSATYTYDAWGNVLTHTGSASVPLQYNGQYTDTETGLQYLRARYYDPATGQFLTRDPLGVSTRAPYQYANNDVLNSSDPAGLAADRSWEVETEYRDNRDRYVPLRIGYTNTTEDGDIEGWGWSKIWAKHTPLWDIWGSATRDDIGRTLANPTSVYEEAWFLGSIPAGRLQHSTI